MSRGRADRCLVASRSRAKHYSKWALRLRLNARSALHSRRHWLSSSECQELHQARRDTIARRFDLRPNIHPLLFDEIRWRADSRRTWPRRHLHMYHCQSTRRQGLLQVVLQTVRYQYHVEVAGVLMSQLTFTGICMLTSRCDYTTDAVQLASCITIGPSYRLDRSLHTRSATNRVS